jgi:hypothetical protein
MNLSAVSTAQIILAIAVAVLVVAGILLFVRKRRTERLRTKFGGPEYARAVSEGRGRRQAEAGLDKRADRVESFHIRPLGPDDRARFVESWTRVQARFVDSPGGAVTEADQLLGNVMSTRGYPVSDFEQRAADMWPILRCWRITVPLTKSRSVEAGASQYGRIAASNDSLPNAF